MTLRKRIIACLDVTDGRVVKGTRFVDLVDAGDPVELAARYGREGADEITILDIGATRDARPALLDLISRAAAALDVPLAVGGGVRSVDDAAALLDAGADKVAVNSAALRDPTLVGRLADRLGSQSVVVAIDAARFGGDAAWRVRSVAATEETGRDAVAWAREAVERGAGELLVTSIDRDGTRSGYDLALTGAIAGDVRVPVIASGGAGSADDVADVLDAGASAALLASTLHFDLLRIGPLKEALAARGISIRAPAQGADPRGGGRVAWLNERRPDWSRGDLLPVVVTDAAAGDLLMLAWANREAVEATERSGEAHFWSRSRDELWRKGATSGNTMRVVSMAVDCDADAIAYRVDPAGPACHTGARSCFDGDGPVRRRARSSGSSPSAAGPIRRSRTRRGSCRADRGGPPRR